MGIYTKISGLLWIFFSIMAEVGNLDTYLGGYFSLFIMAGMDNLLEKITDSDYYDYD